MDIFKFACMVLLGWLRSTLKRIVDLRQMMSFSRNGYACSLRGKSSERWAEKCQVRTVPRAKIARLFDTYICTFHHFLPFCQSRDVKILSKKMISFYMYSPKWWQLPETWGKYVSTTKVEQQSSMAQAGEMMLPCVWCDFCCVCWYFDVFRVCLSYFFKIYMGDMYLHLCICPLYTYVHLVERSKKTIFECCTWGANAELQSWWIAAKPHAVIGHHWISGAEVPLENAWGDRGWPWMTADLSQQSGFWLGNMMQY